MKHEQTTPSLVIFAFLLTLACIAAWWLGSEGF